jgi:hypothetical protein
MVLKPLSRRRTPIGVSGRYQRFHWSCIPLVWEKREKRYSKSDRVFFDGLDAGNSMSVLNATCVAAQQSGTSLDVTLTEVARLAKLS